MKHFDFPVKKMTIIGVGLIGGSLGLKCKLEGLAEEVVGVGRGVKNLQDARALGAIDSYTHSAAEGVEDAQLVVLAVPVGSYRDMAKAVKPHLMKGALVTDVGSVKGSVVEMLEKSMPAGVDFVGAHPIAGKEKAGAAHSDPELFEGARVILTPTGKTDEGALAAVTALWEKVGSEVSCMDPYQHDVVLAAVSHLPQITASSLSNAVKELSRGDLETLKYCGGGFRDTTRVASSPPEMWRDICLYNREEVLNAVRKLQEVLKEAEARIKEGDGEALLEMFQRARGFRDGILNMSEE